ncbi:MAG: hypothetical protein ABIR68_07555 [Ilumatobacteraceae bacterium]
MVNVLSIIGVLVVFAGIYYVGYRLEPHWVSKDARRLLCNVQMIGGPGGIDGRAKETRITVLSGGSLQLDRRRGVRRGMSQVCTLTGKAPDPPPRRAVYLLDTRLVDGTPVQYVLRLPANSRAVPVLDAILERRAAR